MITKGLLEKFYEAASIQRWNDHARPGELVELDKQAHKIMIAYIIAKYEENDRDAKIDWIKLIEGGIFEFLQRVILTDIKPMVFHKMMSKKGKELNQYVLNRIDADIRDLRGGFKSKFKNYLFDHEYAKYEKHILMAAHYLATNWEFKLIYHLNPFIYRIDKTKEEIENRIEDFYDLIGVQKISLQKKTYGFIDLCGQLRFQKRWAGSPRIPQTSVLGHMLIVAMISYIASVEISASEKRAYNNFYAGLFHDIAEVLTRDIISPIKRSVEGLDEIIKEYERSQIEEVLYPLLPGYIQKEINYFVDDEFENKITENGIIKKGISSEEISKKYDGANYSPVDGHIIKACDDLAAFIEACLSMEYGISSHHLKEARENLIEKYMDKKIESLNFGSLFKYFI